MALAGTLEDFSLADIFQLIGLQKKTGTLTLKRDEEEVVILFENGMVVGAEANTHKFEDQLGRVLVSTQAISQRELDLVLEVQRKTLQRLGQILVQKSYLQPKDLSEALHSQILQIIFRLFLWTSGSYHFEQERYVDYDHAFFSPITSESILMEGVRRMDEWPLIKRVLPDFQVYVNRTAKGWSVKLPILTPPLTTSVDGNFDHLFNNIILENKRFEKAEPQFDEQEQSVLRLIQGPIQIQQLIDRSGLNEFDLCHTLCALIEKEYLQKVAQPESGDSVEIIEEEHHIPFWLPASLLITIAFFSFSIGWNPLNRFFHTPIQFEATESQYVALTQYQLHKIGKALDLYYAKKGELPDSLDELHKHSFLLSEELIDSLGHKVRYEKVFGKNICKLSTSGLVVENSALFLEKKYPPFSLPPRSPLEN